LMIHRQLREIEKKQRERKKRKTATGLYICQEQKQTNSKKTKKKFSNHQTFQHLAIENKLKIVLCEKIIIIRFFVSGILIHDRSIGIYLAGV